MKALTLTQLSRKTSEVEFLVSDIEFVGLLYNKKNYEFKLNSLINKENFYIVRSNGPLIRKIYERKIKNQVVKLCQMKNASSAYIIEAYQIEKNKTISEESILKEKNNLNPDLFIEFLNSFNLGISTASNRTSLILTSLPNEKYEIGLNNIKEIFEYARK